MGSRQGLAVAEIDRPVAVSLEARRGQPVRRSAGGGGSSADYIVYGIPGDAGRGPVALGVAEVTIDAGADSVAAQVRRWFKDHAFYGRAPASSATRFRSLMAVRGTAVSFL